MPEEKAEVKKTYSLKSSFLQNYKSIKELFIEYDGRVTTIVGTNGSGKTTVGVDSLAACLFGVSDRPKPGQIKGQRYSFIGQWGKNATIERTIVDNTNGAEIKVRRVITPSGSKLTFKAPDGYEVSEEWLHGLLNVGLLSAKHFCSLPGDEQALVLGIKVKGFNDDIAEQKDEIKIANRQVEDLGNINFDITAVESVDVDALNRQKDEIRKSNAGRLRKFEEGRQSELESNQDFDNDQRLLFSSNNEVRTKITEMQGNISSERDNIVTFRMEVKRKEEALENSIKSLSLAEKELADCEEMFSKMKQPQQLKGIGTAIPEPILESTGSIDSQIERAVEVNKLHRIYIDEIALVKKCEALSNILAAFKSKIGELETKKNEYVKSFDFGFKGLTVDDKNCLQLNGRAIREGNFSTGELINIVAKLKSKQNESLKVVFIDDINNLDEENQVKVVKGLEDSGFQVIIGKVGNKKSNANEILIKEGSIVKSYDEAKGEKLI